MVSQGEESGWVLTWVLWLSCSPEAAVQLPMAPSLPSPKKWIRLEETLPCSFTQVLARRLSCLPHGLMGCLTALDTSPIWGRERGRLRQKPQCLYNTVSGKTYQHVCCILVVTQTSPATVWGHTVHQVCIPGGRITEGHCGLCPSQPILTLSQGPQVSHPMTALAKIPESHHLHPV